VALNSNFDRFVNFLKCIFLCASLCIFVNCVNRTHSSVQLSLQLLKVDLFVQLLEIKNKNKQKEKVDKVLSICIDKKQHIKSYTKLYKLNNLS
jgi:hypothetical protein